MRTIAASTAAVVLVCGWLVWSTFDSIDNAWGELTR